MQKIFFHSLSEETEEGIALCNNRSSSLTKSDLQLHEPALISLRMRLFLAVQMHQLMNDDENVHKEWKMQLLLKRFPAVGILSHLRVYKTDSSRLLQKNSQGKGVQLVLRSVESKPHSCNFHVPCLSF